MIIELLYLTTTGITMQSLKSLGQFAFKKIIFVYNVHINIPFPGGCYYLNHYIWQILGSLYRVGGDNGLIITLVPKVLL